ncbi:MAG: TolC family protein [Chlorobi bacterium]|nr:TolC family protein [Chlorobiota bacterium]
MTKRILIVLLALLPISIFAQEVTLDECINAAKQNWPAFKKKLSIDEQKKLIDETLNKSYLPKLNLSGQATYQSETITFPEMPGVPSIYPDFPNDNYNVELSVNQIIWDGGAVKSEKEIQHAANDIDLQKLNVETYGLVGKVNQLYSNYLYLNKSEDVLLISKDELEKNIKTLQSAYENGTILKSDLDNIKAEKLKLDKDIIRIQALKLNTLKSINLITGLNLDKSYNFAEPVIKEPANAVRPELSLLDAQYQYTSSTVNKFKTNRMPKFFAFGKAGYGRPGYDFMNTDMHGYAMIGAKFTWDVFDWNLFKKQKQNVMLQQQIIQDSKETLQKQITIEENQYIAEIAQYKKQIAIDKNIIKLKESVYKAGESQMNNGTITSTEYLKMFNEWKRAKLTSELDKLKLITAELNYIHSKGISN